MNDKSMPYDDEYCFLKIKEGDEYFFNLIFEKYRNKLFAYLFKVSKSKEVAEEIVLDVFLKIWHGREAITEIKNFEAFLYSIAHNKAIDFFRAAKRNPTLQEAIWQVMNLPESSEKSDDLILIKNTNALIREAIAQLTPQRRKVFELRTDEELSYAEIAKTLKLSSNTVRNHLAASIQFVKEYLQKNSVIVFLITFFSFD